VFFIDKNNGWICSRSSILKTTNGGENWDIKLTDSLGGGRFYDIKFLNNKIGFAAGCKGFIGSSGVLLKTTDGGETWEDITPEGISRLTNFSIVNERNIWVCGYDGTILLTNDLGTTWIKKKLNSIASFIVGIQFIDQNHGWVICDDNDGQGFFGTTDGGNSWKRCSNEWYLSMGFQALFFADSLHGWVSSILGARSKAILETFDGGQTWKLLPEGTILYRVHSFCFINKDFGWTVGIEGKKATGVILRYKSSNYSNY
jgi:photosystem II stability/assembly factor-like uncharacterized protein